MDISEAKGMLDEFISQTNEMDSRGRGMVCLTNGQHTTKR